jgi:hypothetical protein
VFILFVVVFISVLVECPLAVAQDPAPSGNGDVDGSGAIDVSDPLYLLIHMFLGGPEPVPIVCPECPECTECPECPECPQCPSVALPSTNQRACYDDLGRQILCNNTEFPGQDGFHRAGCSPNGRFVDNVDGTITDACTGLMWTQDTLNLDANPDITVADTTPWKTALSFCDTLSFAEHSDWRLPNIRELGSLSYFDEFGAAGPPEVDPSFGLVPPGTYWTSTNDIQAPRNAWVIVFESGGIFPNSTSKNNPRNVLAVRDATAP